MSGSTLTLRTVATRLTVPAGTAIATPATLNVALGFVTVRRIELRIPSGHMGFTGFAIDQADIRLLPWNNAAEWVIGDSDLLEYDFDLDAPRNLTLKGYNTGAYAHTFYLRFGVTDISKGQTTSPALLLP